MKSEQEDVKQAYTRLVQTTLGKTDTAIKNFDYVKDLTDDELVTLFDYLNKSFEMISNGLKPDYHANNLLKLYQKLVAEKGKAIILKSISRQRTLVNRYDNFKNTKI